MQKDVIDNQWISKINERNTLLTDFKGLNKTEYMKYKLGLTHGKGKRKKKKKK